MQSFPDKVSIQNLDRVEWSKMVDDEGNILHGIQGRAGVVGIVQGGGAMGADLIRVEPGSSFPLHTHPGAHILFITEGAGLILVMDAAYPMRAGDTVFVAAEYPHSVQNPRASTGALVFLAVGFPHYHVNSKERMRVVRHESHADTER